VRAAAITSVCLVIMVMATLSAQTRTGSIQGHVKVTGDLPGNSIIRMGMDPKCAEMHRGERVLQQGVVAAPDGSSLANVFVRLEGEFPQTAVPAEPVTVDQKGCLYYPRVVGMRVGQKLQVRNSDDLLHNVHSSSAVGNSFNVGQPKAGMLFEFTPRTEEAMVKLGCDIHSWMTTYIGVVSHPYFAVTDTQGAFTIRSVPPGTYRLHFWHERFGDVTKTVAVRGGAVATIDYGFEAHVR
jgi:Carboxypeptidase regulatory-like domain